MHTYKVNIRAMAKKGGDALALLRGIEGVSRRTNKVFEFSTIRLEHEIDNVNNPSLSWYVWEVEDDGLYCLTYTDEVNRKQTIYYHKQGGVIGEVSLTEAITLAGEESGYRKVRQLIKRRERRRTKRKAERQLYKEQQAMEAEEA